jgi:hypothetical protein
MGDSPRLFDVDVKVNYLGLKLKHRSDRLSTARARTSFHALVAITMRPSGTLQNRLLHNPSVAGGRHSSYNSVEKTM